jgi:hypothetical protein
MAHIFDLKVLMIMATHPTLKTGRNTCDNARTVDWSCITQAGIELNVTYDLTAKSLEHYSLPSPSCHVPHPHELFARDIKYMEHGPFGQDFSIPVRLIPYFLPIQIYSRNTLSS